MCGIIGYINYAKTINERKKFAAFLKQAIHCDTLRGHHGTGVLGVDDKGKMSMYKRDLSGHDFIELQKAKDIIDSTDNVFAVAHNRWATRGTASNENTHPFQHGDITLFHNGTVTNIHSLSKEKFNVDSDGVSYLINQNDMDYKSILEEFEGGYSLVFYNEFDNTLNFARNEEKPMAFIKLDTGSYIFGSEIGMIEWLAKRNGLVIESSFTTKPGTVLTIPLDPNEDVRTISFKPKEAVLVKHYPYFDNKKKSYRFSYIEDLEIMVTAGDWVPYNNTHKQDPEQNGYIKCTSERYHNLQINISQIQRKHYHNYKDKTLKVKINSVTADNIAYARFISIVSPEKTDNTIPFLLKGPNKSKITRHDFLTKVKDGCSMCTTPLTEHNEVTWDNEGNPFCSDCAEHYGLIEVVA